MSLQGRVDPGKMCIPSQLDSACRFRTAGLDRKRCRTSGRIIRQPFSLNFFILVFDGWKEPRFCLWASRNQTVPYPDCISRLVPRKFKDYDTHHLPGGPR